MALDKLEVMQAFCRIIETGSFTQAANKLGVATTTLSGQIQGLENHLGVKLLYRTTRKVSPTADGLAYYQRILPLLSEFDEIHNDLQEQEEVCGLLNVEMPSPVADYLIVPNLPQFTAKYPKLRLEIGSSERVVDLTKERVDCAIRGGVVADENLVAKEIGQMPFCLCATSDYLANNPPILSLNDLQHHRYLSFKFAATGKQSKILPVDQPPFEPPFQLTFNNAQTYYLGTLAGLGVGYLPKVAAEPYFCSGQLQPVLPEQAFYAMPMYFVYPYSGYTPKRVKLFLAWLEELISENPLWQR